MPNWNAPILALVVPALGAASVAMEPIAEDVRGSSRIARVEVVALEHQTFLFEGRTESCGIAYRVAVKDELLGGEQSFWVLGPQDEASAEKGADLFVIAHKPDDAFREKFMRTMEQVSPLVRERARCSFRSRDWHFDRLLMRFDRSAATQFDGEWLRTTPKGPHWKEDLGRRRVSEGASSYEVVSWPLVREAVLAELGRIR